MVKKLILASVVLGVGLWTLPGCGNTDKKTEKTTTTTETSKEVKEKEAKKP